MTGGADGLDIAAQVAAEPLADLADLMAPRWTSFKGIPVPLIWESVRTSIIYLAIAMTPTLIICISLLVPVQP